PPMDTRTQYNEQGGSRVDFELTPDQRAVRDLVRAFAREEVAPHATEADRTGQFPQGLLARLAELDLFALPFPPEYGGLGGDTISYALAIEELAWADASLALTYAAHCSLGAGYLHLFGSPEQKARWLTPAARDRKSTRLNSSHVKTSY